MEMPSAWPAAALEAQAIASRSYAARRLRPGVSTYDVTDDSSSQVYRGVKGERSVTNLVINSTAGSCSGAVPRSSTPSSIRPAVAGPKQRERVHLRDGHQGRRSGELPARVARPRAGRGLIRCRVSVCHVVDADIHRAQMSSWLGADPRTSVGTLLGDRPPEPGRVGAAHQRDAHRVGWQEVGLGRGLPLGVQRPASVDGPIDTEHAARDRSDPLSHGYRGRHADATTPLRLGRRRWSITGPSDGRVPR